MQTTLYRKHSNRTVFFWPMSRDSVCRLTMNNFSSEENMEPVIFPPRSRKDSNLLFSDGILARNVPFQVFEGSIPTLPGNENFSAWCVFCRGYGCPLIFIIYFFFPKIMLACVGPSMLTIFGEWGYLREWNEKSKP